MIIMHASPLRQINMYVGINFLLNVSAIKQQLYAMCRLSIAITMNYCIYSRHTRVRQESACPMLLGTGPQIP